jgi:hypothetical protein
MQLRFLISVVSLLVFPLTPSLRAAEVQWPAKLGHWISSATPEPVVVPGVSTANVPSGVLKESGFVGASSHLYRDGDRFAQMTLYVFHDSSGAYEAYTSLQAMASVLDTVNVVVPKSNLVLWIRGNSNFSAEEWKGFESWEQSVSDGVSSPPVATYLPGTDRYPFTERYALGPLGFQEAAKALGRPDAAGLVDQAGFNSGAEAMFAKYKSGRDEATLLLIEYPTPQLAELHLKHMQRAIVAGRNGASVERKGSLLSIVLAPSSQEYAEKLRGAVNYETQVTWSEPSSTATDPPIMSTLVKIFIATGVFMVLTVAVGIAFGGVRVITKRLFPGKVFDRPEQIEVLQLGLSGKPIDPTDLY